MTASGLPSEGPRRNRAARTFVIGFALIEAFLIVVALAYQASR